jgi:hypothetical protein
MVLIVKVMLESSIMKDMDKKAQEEERWQAI